MERSAVMFDAALPGYDARIAASSSEQRDEPQFQQSPDQYEAMRSHNGYLGNDAYSKYLRMHKVFVGTSGACELIALGAQLKQEELPRYLDAAGWAYAEAGLALKDESTTSRVELMKEAEACWTRSLASSDRLLDESAPGYLYEDSGPFRTALNIAHAPLMKSIIVGNVTDHVREQAFADTLAIAGTSAVQMDVALKQDDMNAATDHVGFLHESNALLTLHALDDPRYIPLPSTARADTGYYHKEQTHDITIVNQHWGAIKKVIPLEIKAKASARDRGRYKALIVRGKMHLSVEGRYDPRYTLGAFANIYEQRGDLDDHRTVDHATSTMLQLLRLYQQGSGKTEVTANTATRFHDSRYVAHHYKK